MLEKEYYAKGLAACEPRILADTVYFRFRKESWEFPADKCEHIVILRGDCGPYGPAFDYADVKDVRALART